MEKRIGRLSGGNEALVDFRPSPRMSRWPMRGDALWSAESGGNVNPDDFRRLSLIEVAVLTMPSA